MTPIIILIKAKILRLFFFPKAINKSMVRSDTKKETKTTKKYVKITSGSNNKLFKEKKDTAIFIIYIHFGHIAPEEKRGDEKQCKKILKSHLEKGFWIFF